MIGIRGVLPLVVSMGVCAPETVVVIPEVEQRVASDAVDQFIVRGRPRVMTGWQVFDYSAGRPVLVERESCASPSSSVIPRGQEDAFGDFQRRNRRPAVWDRPPEPGIPCAFAPPVGSSLCDYWNGLSRDQPGGTGVLTVTRPGFSADGRTAWIRVHINTGPGTSPRLDWWVHLRRGASGWSMQEARTLTELDRWLARLPEKLSRRGASLDQFFRDFERGPRSGARGTRTLRW